MFNSSRPSKEETEKQKRALEELHNAHLQQSANKPTSGDQPTGIELVIADWLTTAAGSAVASVASPGDKKSSNHPKKKEAEDLLICLSVPSDDHSRKKGGGEEEETKLVILDDYDKHQNKKKTHSRHNSATPAPADSAEAASDLAASFLGQPTNNTSATTTTSTSSSSSPSSSSSSTAPSTPPVASAPAAVGGVGSPSVSQQQQPQAYTPPAQYLPPPYYSGSSSGGSSPGPASFHPPPYQNIGPAPGYGGNPFASPPPPYYAPQQQPQQQAYPMYQQPPMGYPQQQQMVGGYNQPQQRPLGLSAHYTPQGQMASPLLPVSAPEQALADQLSNLNLARQNFMQQQQHQHQPPPQQQQQQQQQPFGMHNTPPLPYHGGGLMQPLVPLVAPIISSPDPSAAAAAAASSSGSDSSTDEWHIEYSELETNKEIARGSFGVVYQGAFRGTEVAVKKLIQQHFSPEQMKDFLDEINMMKKLHHPNVVLLIGVCVKEPNLCIVTELLAGSMWNLLHDKSVRLDWKLQHKLLLDTAKGMNYLHLFKPPIIHRDLKSPNLLVDSHFNVKIADFGLARIKAQLMTGNLGTCQYMAPEVITSATYSEKADVYSYGVVVWEVITRQAPWQGMQPMQIAYGVVHQSLRPPIPPGTALPLVQLMQQCWHQDPAQRPSFTDILKQLKTLPLG